MQTLPTKKIAVLIDAENVSHNDIKVIFNEIRGYGTITVKRAFGNIKCLQKWDKVCLEEGIAMCPQGNATEGKNASDFNLVINAMDLLYKKETIDCFVIVSSDSDYFSLVNRIKEDNKQVIGIGEQKTPQALKNACTDFVYIENLKRKPDSGHTINKENLTDLKQIHRFVKKTIAKTDNNQFLLSRLFEAIKNQYPDFHHNSYDYTKFRDFVRDIKEVKVEFLEDKTTLIAILEDEEKTISNSKSDNTNDNEPVIITNIEDELEDEQDKEIIENEDKKIVLSLDEAVVEILKGEKNNTMNIGEIKPILIEKYNFKKEDLKGKFSKHLKKFKDKFEMIPEDRPNSIKLK